jgi:hypothetical protein
MASPLHTIDVAHPPRHPDVVELDLLDALARVRRSDSLRVLKIIHGYGSSGRGGSTKEIVKNVLFRQRSRCRSVIDGERYGLLDPDTEALRAEVGRFPDEDLDAANPGITIVWVR